MITSFAPNGGTIVILSDNPVSGSPILKLPGIDTVSALYNLLPFAVVVSTTSATFSYSESSAFSSSDARTFVNTTVDSCVSKDFPALSLASSGTIASDCAIGLSDVETITFCNPLNSSSFTALTYGSLPDVNCVLSVISCHPLFEFASNDKLFDT